MPPDLLDTLCNLLPAQLDLLIAKLDAPAHHLPGPNAPQATRAIDLLRWADQRPTGRADLQRLLTELTTQPPAAPARNPWGPKLTGPEIQELARAFLSAFPARTSLAQMLLFGLDKSLDTITSERNNLNTTTVELLTTANTEGWIHPLIDAARAHNPGNPDLRALVEKRRP
ncbi:MAG: effector-associated domain EAD1-containing protein [Byssovorax sp.]